jgi:hypothetical protein
LIQNGYKLNITSVAVAKLEKKIVISVGKSFAKILKNFDEIDYIKKCRVI